MRFLHVAWVVGLVLWVSCALPDDFVKVDAGVGGATTTTGDPPDGGGGVGGSGGSGGGSGECPSSFSGSIPFECDDTLLFDGKNCCAMGRDCGDGECSNGMCSAYLIVDAVAANDPELRSLVILNDLVVWSTGSSGRVLAAPKEGGPISELVTDAARFPAYMVAGEGQVFWLSANAPDVFRVDAGGAEALVATVPSAAGFAYGRITYWEGALFFARDETPGGIYRASATGTDETAVLVADASSPEGIATDNNAFFFTEPALGQVSRLALADINLQAPEVIADGQTLASHLVNDANNLYWSMEGAIRSMNKGATTWTELAASANIHGAAVLVDDSYVYWVEYDSANAQSTAWKASKYDGGNPLQIMDPVADNAVALAQDCDNLYIGLMGGQILRVTK